MTARVEVFLVRQLEVFLGPSARKHSLADSADEQCRMCSLFLPELVVSLTPTQLENRRTNHQSRARHHACGLRRAGAVAWQSCSRRIPPCACTFGAQVVRSLLPYGTPRRVLCFLGWGRRRSSSPMPSIAHDCRAYWRRRRGGDGGARGPPPPLSKYTR